MTTSNTSSSSGELAAAPICYRKEDIPATGLVLAVALPATVACTAETVSGTRTPASCPALAVESWVLSSPVVPWAADP
jgi:hypothetical protein